MSRAWDFGYAPVTPAASPPEPARLLIVATAEPAEVAAIARAAGTRARAESVIARAPLHWTRLVLDVPALPEEVAARLDEAGIEARYVASAERASLALGAPLCFEGAATARAAEWPLGPRNDTPRADPATPGTWFLRDEGGGVGVLRAIGCGAGTRLAVIDDEALHADLLDLASLVPIELGDIPESTVHGALMVAWASGARGFDGVAPDASRRLYVIPKPGQSLLALPLAIARAALDGADVIVCATYVEGSTSPMLDDALEVAIRLGRRGRGAAVVMPTGRETSSPPGSLHASFSLGLGEPACDPRVLCVAPGAKGGGWFLWRAQRGRLRPFANRGPSVRWLAPGDDIAYPFATPERLFHAESSGASAIAAGVLLTVLGVSPSLTRAELTAIVDSTLTVVPPEPAVDRRELADAADVLPRGVDRDGHNAKHGLGAMHAGRACLAAIDPFCAALVAAGEEGAAAAFARMRRADRAVRRAYSRRLGRFAARAALADRSLAEAFRAIVRHLRLVAGRGERLRAHGDGALLRRLQLLVRRLAATRAPPAVAAELATLAARLAALAASADHAARCEHALATVMARALDGAASTG